MKRFIILFLFFFILLTCHCQLNSTHNSYRAGDIIIKQQVEYINPGKAGADLLWDFSKLKPVDSKYELSYSTAPLLGDSIYIMGYNKFRKDINKHVDLIVAEEHNTMYYLYQTPESVSLLGHENVAVKQENTLPINQLVFPLSYGQHSSSSYKSYGIHSSFLKSKMEGFVNIQADAYGTIISPEGDTISPVLRVATEQTIQDLDKGNFNNKNLLKSYRWYSKGYRYPIFEVLECINLNTDKILFSTAFYYPPQDHLYLATDPENQELLDELWEYTQEKSNFKTKGLFKSEKGFDYRIYPNPVTDRLNIAYALENNSPVNIIMATIDGKVVKNIFYRSKEKGDQVDLIDCSHLITGIYLLKVIAGDIVISEKILKK